MTECILFICRGPFADEGLTEFGILRFSPPGGRRRPELRRPARGSPFARARNRRAEFPSTAPRRIDPDALRYHGGCRLRAQAAVPVGRRDPAVAAEAKHRARDFADGVLVAEVIAHFYPRLIELHNYSSANAMTQKMYNWQTLNQRALRKLGFRSRSRTCRTAATTRRARSSAC